LIRSLINRLCLWQKRQIGFRNEFNRFKMLLSDSQRDDFRLTWEDRYPVLEDKTSTTSFDAHYIYHTAWAARILQENNITYHVDISSSLYFSSIVSAFIPVHFYDYRPAVLNLNQLDTSKADILMLPFESDSIPSLSCMHVIEHIGLGRYGDPLDPNGDRKAMSELCRVIKPGGQLLFVVPVGKPAIRFNAHRIYDPLNIINDLPGMELSEFSCVLDSGEFYRRTDPTICTNQDYACGMYFLKKYL